MGNALADHPLAAALRAAFAAHRDVVLQAPPGAGKSTLVPLALLDEPWLAGRKILMLEPRRLAARAVASRMADTLGERVGESIGYRMRMDTRVSARTRIEVITEGVLTRLLQGDPALDGVGCVIFDEFHERSLQADLGLALCLDARRQLDAPFRLLMMSATLDGERVAGLIGATVVSVPGRQFPVEIRHVGRAAPLLPGAPSPSGGFESPERLVVQVIRRALQETAGDLLVFLPGAGEIRRVQGQLGDVGRTTGAGSAVRVLPLYGELSAEEQDAALAPGARGTRKVVLATNIAETSLTIPGVTVVIDSGLARRSRFDPGTGMSRLEVVRISRASSEQRAGRAGRTAPGTCYRLWSEGAQQSLAAHTPPEIQEADLTSLALDLAQWGSPDAQALAWLDRPPVATLAQARELLQRLDALDAQGRITATGRAMARLPVHPRLAHLLLAARAGDAVELGANLGALLSERDLLRGAGSARDPDLATRLELLRSARTESGADADRFLLQRVRRNAEQLARATREAPASAGVTGRAPVSTALLLACAFPDRIGQLRAGGERRYLLANGRGAHFASHVSLANSEFIVAVELDDKDREARIDLAIALPRAELEQGFAAHIRRVDRLEWDSRSAAVSARRQRTLDALVLEDKPLPDPPVESTVAAMLQGVRELGIAALPWTPELRTLQARMEFVRALARGDTAGWPASDDATLAATLEDWLAPWLEGVTRRDHLQRVSLGEALLARLGHAQRRQLDELAPREQLVPSGSRIRIDYLDDNAPCVAVRLNEVFGLAHTPRIGGGQVPITFKLLSPAQRPVQITRDLEGFWKRSYLEVRKDLRGRYPRHNWPENPLEAQATVRSLKKPPRRG